MTRERVKTEHLVRPRAGGQRHVLVEQGADGWKTLCGQDRPAERFRYLGRCPVYEVSCARCRVRLGLEREV